MKIALYFYNIPHYLKCLSVIHEADYIYLPYEYFTSGTTKEKGKYVNLAGPNDTMTYNAEELSKEKYIATFPYITKDNTKKKLYTSLSSFSVSESFQIQNLGDLTILNNIFGSLDKLNIYGDYSFNIQNKQSLDMLYDLGFKSLTLSPELNTENIFTLAESVETKYLSKERYLEIIGYGLLILMRSEHCYISDKKGYHCNKCLNDKYSIKDKTGACFPIVCDPTDCRSVMLDRLPVMLTDISFLKRFQKLRSFIMRLNIFDESPSTIASLIKFYKYSLWNDELDKLKYYQGSF